MKNKYCYNVNKNIIIMVNTKEVSYRFCPWTKKLEDKKTLTDLERQRQCYDSWCQHTCRIDKDKNGSNELLPRLVPETVELSITNICNNDCYYCYTVMQRDQPTIWPLVKDKIEERFIKNCKTLSWTNGEFYLAKSVAKEMLNYREKYNLELHVPTNGTCFDPSLPVDWVTLSLHACSPEAFKYSCRVDYYNKLMRNLPLLQEYEGWHDTSVMLNKWHLEHPDILFDWVCSNVPKRVTVHLLRVFGDRPCKTHPRPIIEKLEKDLRAEGFNVFRNV